MNDYAPEHCQVLSDAPFDHPSHIRNASEVLLGNWAAGTLANYVLGLNCVLLTGAGAKVHSPLGVRDFMKSGTVAHVTRAGFEEAAPITHCFAKYRGRRPCQRRIDMRVRLLNTTRNRHVRGGDIGKKVESPRVATSSSRTVGDGFQLIRKSGSMVALSNPMSESGRRPIRKPGERRPHR